MATAQRLTVPLPDPPCQAGAALPHQCGDGLGPARLLAAEETDRHVQSRAGVVNWEPAAPIPRGMREVFVGEELRGRLHLLVGERESEWHAGKLRQEGRDRKSVV